MRHCHGRHCNKPCVVQQQLFAVGGGFSRQGAKATRCSRPHLLVRSMQLNNDVFLGVSSL